MRKFATLIAVFGIMALGVGIAVFFVKTRPRVEKKNPPRMTPIVQVEPLEKGLHSVTLELLGTVIAARQVDLKAQVAGLVEEVHPQWVEGGMLRQGDVVARLENDDFRIRLAQAESALASAQSDLALEMGRQDVARREWEMLGSQGSELDRDLALRVPQLKSAQARVSSAVSQVEQARLDFGRTVIRAPFNALVVNRGLNKGDVATTQAILGRLVATDEYHARISIPVDQLKWIRLPDEKHKEGATARIVLAGGSERAGRVMKLLADLEPTGRMARLLVSIDKPLDGAPPALLGSFVRVFVEGGEIEDCYEIRRDHFREGGVIWLLTPQKTLRVQRISPSFSDRDRVIFCADIQPGERLIASDLSAPVDGMSLRLPGDDRPPPAQSSKAEGRPGRRPPEGGQP